jgi:hypothetical protein
MPVSGSVTVASVRRTLVDMFASLFALNWLLVDVPGMGTWITSTTHEARRGCMEMRG